MNTKKIFLYTIFALSAYYFEAYAVPAGTVMAFAPHPDDDIIGCGGALAQHVKNGDPVTVVYMTSGGASNVAGHSQELADRRELEAYRATEKLGIKNLIFLRELDGRLKRSSETIVKVLDLILEHKPTVIYIPHKSDAHRDHQATFQIVVAALKRLRHVSEMRVPFVFCYEVWTPLIDFNKTINITDDITNKLDALAEHKTQIADHDYVEATKALNHYRGIMTKTGEYAECFYQLKVRA